MLAYSTEVVDASLVRVGAGSRDDKLSSWTEFANRQKGGWHFVENRSDRFETGTPVE